ncbi:MAG: MFS transporter [Candidatus Hodarchaeales archaeon]
MDKKSIKTISPKISLLSAFIIHGCVEIPFFIFPVIVILVGADLFSDMGVLGWFGLGSIGTIGTMAAALPSPFFGRMADKYRRGLMMDLSLGFAIIGSITIGLFGESFLAMLIGVIFLGLGLSLYHPHGLSWISSAFENPVTKSYSSKYVRILSLHGVGGTFGASIGPLSVFFLINTIGWRQIYLLWSIPLVFVAIGFWFLIGQHELHIEHRNSSEIKDKEQFQNNILLKGNFSSVLVLIFAFIATMSLTRGMINFILSPFLSEVKNVEIATAALFVGLSTLVGASGEILGGILGDKYGERNVLSSFALIQVGLLLSIFIINEKIILLGLYILLGIASSLFWPSTNSLVAKNSTKRGRAFGWVMFFAHFFGALGPAVDGILLTLGSNQYLLIFSTACFSSVTGFLLLLLSERMDKKFSKNPTMLS